MGSYPVESAVVPDNVKNVCSTSTYMSCSPYVTGRDPGSSAKLMHVACMPGMHIIACSISLIDADWMTSGRLLCAEGRPAVSSRRSRTQEPLETCPQVAK